MTNPKPRPRRGQGGFVLVLSGILLLTMFALMVVAIDIGRISHTGTEVQGIADSAALAGALAVIKQGPGNARPAATTAAQDNRFDGRDFVNDGTNGQLDVIEGSWDTGDTPNELAGMRLAFSNAIRVSTILNVDADLRRKWQEMLDNLASPSNPGRGRRPANPTGGDAGAPGGAAPATRPGDGNGGGGGAGPAGGGFADGARRGNRPFGAFVYGGPGAIPANEPEAREKSDGWRMRLMRLT